MENRPLRILVNVLFFRPIFGMILEKEKQKKTRSASAGAGESSKMDCQCQCCQASPKIRKVSIQLKTAQGRHSVKKCRPYWGFLFCG
ncbi:hypothetical protein D7X87_25250 [bacterium D16-54]|nr:hypothetical protein D7X87_25250 [bacterium D16-54]RKJ09452.1 hypothetical protein D7X65_25345 [bacterium D16-56]